MNRLGILFIASFFFTLGLQLPETDKARDVHTVQTLFPQVNVDDAKVDEYFEGQEKLTHIVTTKKVDLNEFYQKNAFKRTLASNSKIEKIENKYSTWIEKRDCPSSPHMDRPVRARVTSRYGLRVHPLSGRRHVHAGIDFRGKRGTPVIASAAGFVKSVRRKGAYGKTIIVSHGNSFTTLYGHLSSYGIKEGEWVNQGQTIGYIGQTGRATGPHLHFEVRCHNVPVNPIAFVGKSNMIAKVRFRRRRRVSPITYQRKVASEISVKRDPNYYTRLMNQQALEKMKQRVQ